MSSNAGFSTANRFAVLNDHKISNNSNNDGHGQPKYRQHQQDEVRSNGNTTKVTAGTVNHVDKVNGDPRANGIVMPTPQSGKKRGKMNLNGSGGPAAILKHDEALSTDKSNTPVVDTAAISTTSSRNSTPPLKKARRRNSLRVVRMPSTDGNGHAVKEVVPKKTDWEIPRKTLHASIGFLVLYLRAQNPHSIRPLLISLFTALVIITSTDIMRFNSRKFNLLYIQVCGPLMRQSEEKGWNGVIWYLVGCLVTVGVYPRDVAVVSILTLSWSDTAASTIGRLFSPISPPLPAHLPLTSIPFAKRKSLAGFLAAVITGCGIGLMYWHAGEGKRQDGGWGELWGGDVDLSVWMGGKMAGWTFLRATSWGRWATALVLGVSGAIVEALDLGLDDNMTLPIMTGGILWAWLTVVSALT